MKIIESKDIAYVHVLLSPEDCEAIAEMAVMERYSVGQIEPFSYIRIGCDLIIIKAGNK